jgi:hypothetical protein
VYFGEVFQYVASVILSATVMPTLLLCAMPGGSVADDWK